MGSSLGRGRRDERRIGRGFSDDEAKLRNQDRKREDLRERRKWLLKKKGGEKLLENKCCRTKKNLVSRKREWEEKEREREKMNKTWKRER